MQRNLWLFIFSAVLLWSAIYPHSYLIWTLEVSPALFALLILAVSRRRFPLTPLVYQLILVHAVILMIGGHYTYAEVPLFEQLSERNNFDKLAHFGQGFVPALVTREILLRLKVITSQRWCAFIVVSICLAISAFYELIEWQLAVLSEEAAEDFLSLQGYVWDTQADMACALVGAICGLLWLSRLHDLQLRKLMNRPLN
ncbi:MAG: DUF2238 domain-containing protein [Desulfuromonas sp.]|nr:DUF2238 domain-containing protein [Desulfuromonas sp.]